MRTRNFISAIFLFFALLFVAEIHAQLNRSTISGFVFDPERRPVAQVYVELHSEFSTLGRVRTDGSGRYYFSGLGHGRYTVKVLTLGLGFAEQAEEIEIAGIGVRGQTVTDNVQKDIYLKPRRGSDAIPFQAAVVYAQDVPKEAADQYKRAVEDLDSQRVQTGIEALERAVAIFPDYFEALRRLGMARLVQERFDDAEDLFTRASTINERCFDCWYGGSYAQYSTRKFPEAVRSAEKAVTIKQDSVEANLLLGMSLRSTKNFLGAEKSMLRAAKISDGQNADVCWHLALLYGKDMNRFGDAADALEAYLKAAPTAPNAEAVRKLIKDFRNKASKSK